MITQKKRRFAEAYLKSANATRAAIEAGYSPKTAYAAGYRALRDVEVQALINASLVNRTAHAEVTYQNLISLSLVALEEVKNARGGSDSERLNKAIKAARESLETLGKAEGLFVQRLEHAGPGGAPLPPGTQITTNVLNANINLPPTIDLNTEATTDAFHALLRELDRAAEIHRPQQPGGLRHVRVKEPLEALPVPASPGPLPPEAPSA